MYFFACILNKFWQTFTDLQAVGLEQKIVDYSKYFLISLNVVVSCIVMLALSSATISSLHNRL